MPLALKEPIDKFISAFFIAESIVWLPVLAGQSCLCCRVFIRMRQESVHDLSMDGLEWLFLPFISISYKAMLSVRNRPRLP